MSGTGRDQFYIPETAGTGASPGFGFGRSGKVSAGAYLLNESIPSNKTGRPVGLTNARIIGVVISNELVNTFTIEIEEHDGTTYTSLGTFSLTAERYKSFPGLSISITAGKELAVKVSSGSAKQPLVILYVKGDAA